MTAGTLSPTARAFRAGHPAIAIVDVTELKHTQMARLREADRRIAERTRFAPPTARMTCCDV